MIDIPNCPFCNQELTSSEIGCICEHCDDIRIFWICDSNDECSNFCRFIGAVGSGLDDLHPHMKDVEDMELKNLLIHQVFNKYQIIQSTTQFKENQESNLLFADGDCGDDCIFVWFCDSCQTYQTSVPD